MAKLRENLKHKSCCGKGLGEDDKSLITAEIEQVLGEETTINWKRLYDLMFDKDRRPYQHVLHQFKKIRKLNDGTF